MRGNQTQMRNRVQELVIITLLLWATQTLVNQLAHGAPAAERFVPPAGGFFASTVEIRPDAVVIGDEVKLRQIARWGGADAQALEQTGDLVVARFEKDQDTMRIDLEKLRITLEEAGVNLGAVNFTGAMACKVTRRDVAPVDVDTATERAAPKLLGNVSTPDASVRAMDQTRQTTLKDRLLADLSERFSLPSETFQIRFLTPRDEKLAVLAEPSFSFELKPRKQKHLGLLTWDVIVQGPGGGKQKSAISADVKAWQTILIANRPMVSKQPIGEDDVVEKRMLVDELVENAITRQHVVGQQAGRDIAAGTPITGKLIEAVLLVRVGQLVNVSVEKNGVRVKWVAEAREAGSYGQTIRTRKPGTREEYQVLLSGAGEGKLVGPVGGATAVRTAAKG